VICRDQFNIFHPVHCSSKTTAYNFGGGGAETAEEEKIMTISVFIFKYFYKFYEIFDNV